MKKDMMDFSTIAAIATPQGSGGIGIVRISGKESLGIMSKVFRPSMASTSRAGAYESHRMYHGHLIDPSTGEAVDEVLAVYMKAPRSFTAEDVVEIHGHGGVYVLGVILSIILDQGARMAGPGEFSMRAFLNGRIDLTQAEGILDMIEASSAQALRLAAGQLRGGIRERISGIRERLRTVHAGLEALIDFPDETEDLIELSSLADEMESVILPEMKSLLVTHEETRFLREGVRLVIAGPPNAGKSSLMNALAGEERSIVTSVPGTTRDLVRERLDISGTPVLLTDTAGLRETADEVESMGINLARKAISDADAILWVMDITKGMDGEMADVISLSHARHGIIVCNKSDLADRSIHIGPPFEDMPQIPVSAKTGQGIDFLKKTISEMLFSDSSAGREGLSLNIRHKRLLDTALSCSERAFLALKGSYAVELASEDLRGAVQSLDSILGENLDPDILDDIFSRFCIGK